MYDCWKKSAVGISYNYFIQTSTQLQERVGKYRNDAVYRSAHHHHHHHHHHHRRRRRHCHRHHHHHHYYPSLLQRGFITHSAAYKNLKYPETNKYRDPRSFAPAAFHTKISFLISAHLILLHLITRPTSEDVTQCRLEKLLTFRKDVVPSSSEPSSHSPWTHNYAPSKRRFGPVFQKTCIVNTAVRISNLALEEPTHWNCPLRNFFHLLLLNL